MIVTEMGRVSPTPSSATGIWTQAGGQSGGVVFMENATVDTSVKVIPNSFTFGALYSRYADDAPRNPSEASYILYFNIGPELGNGMGGYSSEVQLSDPFQLRFAPGDSRVSSVGYGGDGTLSGGEAASYLVTIHLDDVFSIHTTPLYQAPTLVSLVIANGQPGAEFTMSGGGLSYSTTSEYSDGYLFGGPFGDFNFHPFPDNSDGVNTFAMGFEYTLHAVVPEADNGAMVASSLLVGYAITRRKRSQMSLHGLGRVAYFRQMLEHL